MCPVCTPHSTDPLPPGFSQVFILNGLKVACFHTLLQVFILKVVSGRGFGSIQAVLGLIVMNGAAWHGAAAVVHKVKNRMRNGPWSDWWTRQSQEMKI